jgi:type IV pilus assembly protein PilA
MINRATRGDASPPSASGCVRSSPWTGGEHRGWRLGAVCHHRNPSIATPAYQDYTIRSQITVGLNAATRYQAAVAQSVEDRAGDLAGVDNRLIGLPEAVNTRFVESIKVVNGAIVITYGAGANPGITNQTLVLVPGRKADHGLVWVCGHADSPSGAQVGVDNYQRYTSVPDKWLPTACRAGGTH